MTADAVGGVWDYALELARGLARAGVETVLAVMGPPPGADQAKQAHRIPGLALATGAYRLEWMDDPWAEVDRAGAWLLELEELYRCDLVHLNGYAHGVVPFRAPKLVVGHSCVLSWFEAVKKGPAPATWQTYAERVRAGLRAADAIAAPTAWMLRALQQHYGLLPSGSVIPNGRAPVDYFAAEKKPFVLCAGRLWDEAKNAAQLARVASRLPWPVKIAGATTLDATRDTLPAFDGAELLGRLPSERLAALYAEASVYALPARYEPFGLTVLEAALSGCALVLGDIPSLRELWDNAALFVPPDDAEALTAAVAGLTRDSELLQGLAHRAVERAARYRPERMVDGYLTLYRSLRELRTPAVSAEVQPCAS